LPWQANIVVLSLRQQSPNSIGCSASQDARSSGWCWRYFATQAGHDGEIGDTHLERREVVPSARDIVAAEGGP